MIFHHIIGSFHFFTFFSWRVFFIIWCRRNNMTRQCTINKFLNEIHGNFFIPWIMLKNKRLSKWKETVLNGKQWFFGVMRCKNVLKIIIVYWRFPEKFTINVKQHGRRLSVNPTTSSLITNTLCRIFQYITVIWDVTKTRRTYTNTHKNLTATKITWKIDHSCLRWRFV